MMRRRWLRRVSTEVNCREVGRALQHYLDGDVDADFASRIADHLDKCKDCGLEHKAYVEIKASLTRGNVPVDDAVLDRLRDFGDRLTGG